MMQDIDFDELDRAVSSTLSPSVTPPVENSVPVQTSSAPTPVVTEPNSFAPAARRSSGRFMDVVHPSSDMRTSSTERSAPRPPEPIQPEETTAPATSEWPDPLDFHGFKDEPEEVTPAPEEKPDDTAVSLESPFITDAKVEKRPLGAFSTAEAPTIPPVEKPALETPEEPLLLEAPEEEPLLEGTNESDIKTPEAETLVAQPDTSPVPVEEIPVGPTSITQQYKEQPSTTEQTSGAIFDTESYHQPLVHQAKKKSGALVIVWIAALILVGAGAGAAVYFFVLPML